MPGRTGRWCTCDRLISKWWLQQGCCHFSLGHSKLCFMSGPAMEASHCCNIHLMEEEVNYLWPNTLLEMVHACRQHVNCIDSLMPKLGSYAVKWLFMKQSRDGTQKRHHGKYANPAFPSHSCWLDDWIPIRRGTSSQAFPLTVANELLK